MRNQKLKWIFALGLLLPSLSNASFIETTMGAAVLNDATAAYFNPAALVLLPNTQIIPLVSESRFKTQFTGQATTVATSFSQYGSSSSTSNFFSPSFYFGMPIQDRLFLGFSVVSNFGNRDPEQNSILRYVQSSNSIQDYDVVPAVAFKVNDCLGLGGGINFSYTSFDLHPIIGFPGTNIPDGEGSNKSNGSGGGR